MLQNRHSDQGFTGEFPTHPNREIFGGLQGIRTGDQGNYPPVSRNSDFGTILDDIGALKMPFLAHTGRKSNRFRDATASPSSKLSS